MLSAEYDEILVAPIHGDRDRAVSEATPMADDDVTRCEPGKGNGGYGHRCRDDASLHERHPVARYDYST